LHFASWRRASARPRARRLEDGRAHCRDRAPLVTHGSPHPNLFGPGSLRDAARSRLYASQIVPHSEASRTPPARGELKMGRMLGLSFLIGMLGTVSAIAQQPALPWGDLVT